MGLEIVGERAGTRTQDLLIKSQLLYHLSYALFSLAKSLAKDPRPIRAPKPAASGSQKIVRARAV